MPLWKEWTEEGARFAIWQVGETAGELRKRLTSSSLPYDEELACLKAESRRLEYLVVRVLLRTLCGEEKQIQHLPSGKPYLADGSFHITISHTRDIWLSACIHNERWVLISSMYPNVSVRSLTGLCIQKNLMNRQTLLICLCIGRLKKQCIR